MVWLKQHWVLRKYSGYCNNYTDAYIADFGAFFADPEKKRS
jgi:hypothetical protein